MNNTHTMTATITTDHITAGQKPAQLPVVTDKLQGEGCWVCNQNVPHIHKREDRGNS